MMGNILSNGNVIIIHARFGVRYHQTNGSCRVGYTIWARDPLEEEGTCLKSQTH
jgi:hypothetical protein